VLKRGNRQIIRNNLEEHPRTSFIRLSLQTGIPHSTCNKNFKKNLHLHPYNAK
jgi:hypothetical protein